MYYYVDFRWQYTDKSNRVEKPSYAAFFRYAVHMALLYNGKISLPVPDNELATWNVLYDLFDHNNTLQRLKWRIPETEQLTNQRTSSSLFLPNYFREPLYAVQRNLFDFVEYCNWSKKMIRLFFYKIFTVMIVVLRGSANNVPWELHDASFVAADTSRSLGLFRSDEGNPKWGYSYGVISHDSHGT